MNNYKNEVKTFKALTDINRLLILDLLMNGETCSCMMIEKLPIKQSTISHHMKILID
jgi:ArsR family transcriptional regulator